MDIKHKKGAVAKLAVMQDFVSRGYYVYSETNNIGPIDFIAVHPDFNEVEFIDVKHMSVRSKDGSVIHRVRTPLQKKLGVNLIYYDAENKRLRRAKQNVNQIQV